MAAGITGTKEIGCGITGLGVTVRVTSVVVLASAAFRIALVFGASTAFAFWVRFGVTGGLDPVALAIVFAGDNLTSFFGDVETVFIVGDSVTSFAAGESFSSSFSILTFFIAGPTFSRDRLRGLTLVCELVAMGMTDTATSPSIPRKSECLET